MSPSTNLRKRPRSNDAPTDPTTENIPVKQHEDLWFDDGNIILITSEISFRVHRGLLSRHSDVFQGLFTVPQPSDSQKIEDCPVVHLSDSAEDVEHFLRALYDRQYFQPGVTVALAVVSGILRLATKYDVAHLRQEAISRIQSCFPDALDEWDDVRTGRSIPLINYQTGEEIAILNLIHACGVQGVIEGVIYYACCQLDTIVLFDGVPLVNGMVVGLSAEDLRRCIVGRDKLSGLYEQRIDRALWSCSSKCGRGSNCRTDRIPVVRNLRQEFRNYDPLAPLDDLLPHLTANCEACSRTVAVKHAIARGEIFIQLLEIFDITET